MKIVIVVLIVLLIIFSAVLASCEYFLRFALGRNNSFEEKNELDQDNVFSSSEAKQIMKEGKKFLETECESISIKSFDNLRLSAYLNESGKSDYYLITLHGFHGSPDNNAPVFLEAYERGFNILVPHMRSHGESEGKWITMGKNEAEDVLSWIEYIKERNENAKIIVYGVSMGSATTLILSGKESESTVAYIADCGYSSLYEEYFHEAKEMFGLPSFFVRIINLWSRIRIGLDFSAVNPSESVRSNTKPLLIIHGDEDDFVPTWMCYKIYENAGGDKELLVVPEAGHGESMFVMEDYNDYIFSWLEKHGIESK